MRIEKSDWRRKHDDSRRLPIVMNPRAFLSRYGEHPLEILKAQQFIWMTICILSLSFILALHDAFAQKKQTEQFPFPFTFIQSDDTLDVKTCLKSNSPIRATWPANYTSKLKWIDVRLVRGPAGVRIIKYPLEEGQTTMEIDLNPFLEAKTKFPGSGTWKLAIFPTAKENLQPFNCSVLSFEFCVSKKAD
jgi:hypothetical protein